jgi:hypothetical protein
MKNDTINGLTKGKIEKNAVLNYYYDLISMAYFIVGHFIYYLLFYLLPFILFVALVERSRKRENRQECHSSDVLEQSL